MNQTDRNTFAGTLPPDLYAVTDEVLAQEMEFIDLHQSIELLGFTLMTGNRLDQLTRRISPVTIIRVDTPGELHWIVLPGTEPH